jgi:hypothetical protein
MMLISISLGIVILMRCRELKKENIVIVLLILVIIGVSVSWDKVEISPILNEQTIAKWRVERKRGRGIPHAAIVNLEEQKEAVKFFEERIGEKDRIYYLGVFHVGEISTLTDKVFYSAVRYLNNNCENPNGGSSYLILGPYEQGIWSIVPSEVVEEAIKECCDRLIFANHSYSIWNLRKKIK